MDAKTVLEQLEKELSDMADVAETETASCLGADATLPAQIYAGKMVGLSLAVTKVRNYIRKLSEDSENENS